MLDHQFVFFENGVGPMWSSNATTPLVFSWYFDVFCRFLVPDLFAKDVSPMFGLRIGKLGLFWDDVWPMLSHVRPMAYVWSLRRADMGCIFGPC